MWVELGEVGEEDREVLLKLKERLGYIPYFFLPFVGKPGLSRSIDTLEMIITFGGSRLGRFREELIAFYVSVLNGCHY